MVNQFHFYSQISVTDAVFSSPKVLVSITIHVRVLFSQSHEFHFRSCDSELILGIHWLFINHSTRHVRRASALKILFLVLF
jgi:hypothetical protein